MCRPTKLTPELQDRICAAVADGQTYKTAYSLAGINHDTFQVWRDKGKAGRQPYAAFTEALARAESARDAANVASVKLAMTGGSVVFRETVTRTLKDGTEQVTVKESYARPEWQAGAFLLERQNNEEYGKRDTLKQEGGLTITVNPAAALVELVGSDKPTGSGTPPSVAN